MNPLKKACFPGVKRAIGEVWAPSIFHDVFHFPPLRWNFSVCLGGPSGPVLREQKRARQATTKNQISTRLSQEIRING